MSIGSKMTSSSSSSATSTSLVGCDVLNDPDTKFTNSGTMRVGGNVQVESWLDSGASSLRIQVLIINYWLDFYTDFFWLLLLKIKRLKNVANFYIWIIPSLIVFNVNDLISWKKKKKVEQEYKLFIICLKEKIISFCLFKRKIISLRSSTYFVLYFCLLNKW